MASIFYKPNPSLEELFQELSAFTESTPSHNIFSALSSIAHNITDTARSADEVNSLLRKNFLYLRHQAQNNDFSTQQKATAAFYVYLLQGQQYSLKDYEFMPFDAVKDITWLKLAALDNEHAIDLFCLINTHKLIADQREQLSQQEAVDFIMAFYRIKLYVNNNVQQDFLLNNALVQLQQYYGLPNQQPDDIFHYISKHTLFNQFQARPAAKLNR